MPLTAHRNRKTLNADRLAFREAPAAAGHLFFDGAYLFQDDAGLLHPANGVNYGMRPAGVLWPASLSEQYGDVDHHLDTRTLANGSWVGDERTWVLRYAVTESFLFEVQGSPAIGREVYPLDDDLMTTVPTASGVVGGVITRPGPRGGWFVDIAERRAPPRSAITVTVDGGTDALPGGGVGYLAGSVLGPPNTFDDTAGYVTADTNCYGVLLRDTANGSRGEIVTGGVVEAFLDFGYAPGFRLAPRSPGDGTLMTANSGPARATLLTALDASNRAWVRLYGLPVVTGNDLG
ncbi:MAG: hypothetical protein AAGD06_21095 [Acidobacteriota bacterium]